MCIHDSIEYEWKISSLYLMFTSTLCAMFCNFSVISTSLYMCRGHCGMIVSNLIKYSGSALSEDFTQDY